MSNNAWESSQIIVCAIYVLYVKVNIHAQSIHNEWSGISNPIIVNAKLELCKILSIENWEDNDDDDSDDGVWILCN